MHNIYIQYIRDVFHNKFASDTRNLRTNFDGLFFSKQVLLWIEASFDNICQGNNPKHGFNLNGHS